ncbi:MAG: tetratricopeptide repeat protein [Gemmatimonadetes bacterium]|nr:tetratricopeptide repeat protein [Gemmatimonadota bacterium]
MTDPVRVLQPLDAAEAAIRKLTDYEAADELARALQATWAAVQRALRLLLRSDPATPDELRLTALSIEDLPPARLLEVLRQRDLISLELAGQLHELQQAAQRAEGGAQRAADADLARRVAERVRAEVHMLAERPVREAARHAVASRMIEETAHAVPPPGAGRRFVFLAASVALLILVVLAIVVLVALDRQTDKAIAAFRAGRLETAETRFREVLEDEPENVTALLYLGRVYRRQQRHHEAAEVLQQAARLNSGDADVYRELGHLFLALGQLRPAAKQYRHALDLDPEEQLNWIALVRALRALGDPAAERLLRAAPPEVRAALARGP